MSARAIVAPLVERSSRFGKIFCGGLRSGRGHEARVAAFADLEYFTHDIPGLEREPLVLDDLPVEAHGAAPDEAPRLAVGAGEAGQGDEVHYPDLAVNGQLHLRNVLRHPAADDGVEGPLGPGDGLLAVEHPHEGTGEL